MSRKRHKPGPLPVDSEATAHEPFVLRHAAWLAVPFLALAAVFLCRDYGMAWDDAQHAIYGSYVLDYFLSGFKDMRWKTDIGGLYNYGTLFDLPSAVLHRWLGKDLFAYRNLLMALCGVLAVPAVAALGRRLGGQRAALFSVLALVLMPQFVGQSFMNCKDIPLATAMAWSLVALFALIDRPTLRAFLLFGAALGLTLSVRVGGGIMTGLFAAATVGWLFLRELLQGKQAQAVRTALTNRWPLHALLAGLLAWLIMVAFWPFAHANPVLNPWEAFAQSTAFPISYPVLYLGQTWESAKLPWHYLPFMVALTMPVPILLLALGGMALAGAALLRSWKNHAGTFWFVLLFAVLFPPAYVILRNPNIYDGIRHFLFLLPPLAVLAGTAAATLAGTLQRRLGPTGATITVAGFMLVALPALIATHPYQYVFYNILAGDKETLHERFETDYWLTSYKEAAGIIQAEQARAGRPLLVGVGANGLSIPCFTHFLDPKGGTQIGLFLGSSGQAAFPDKLDYTVCVPRYGMWRNFPEAPVFREIRRDGILVCVIRRNPQAP
ncbi:MAG: glycosyltransferase family 39 protein [Candidatus Methylacidiphilales bacterium]|nr:glycosyltransferase family 39 protein [Candidatus Methylacidiphilales bacterium]